VPVALFPIEIIRVDAALRVEASERREKRHLRRVGPDANRAAERGCEQQKFSQGQNYIVIRPR
jgi:hypothetical protein